MTSTDYTGTCAWCGAEYDKRSRINGRLVGYKPLYCSKDCARHAKSRRARDRNRERKKHEQANGTKRVRKSNDYQRWSVETGPMKDYQCFGCPCLGWKCRSSYYPPCRPYSKQHAVYKRAIEWLETIA